VPVLARVIEAAGISTVVVTMMPYLAEASGTPRIVGVEFPFVHSLGHAHDRDEHLRVIRDSLRALQDIKQPNAVVHLPYGWPDFEHWKTAWYPPEPAPIIKLLREQVRQRAEAERRGEGPA